MILRPFPYDLTPEDRLTRARWMRGVAVFYGSAELLLFGFIAAQRMLAEPNGATRIVNAPASSAPPRSAVDRGLDAPTASIAPSDDLDRLHAQATGRSADPRPDAQAKPAVAVGAAR